MCYGLYASTDLLDVLDEILQEVSSFQVVEYMLSTSYNLQ